MSEISLEKIDIIRGRTGVTYTEAKEALEVCNGNVVDALVYIESKAKNENKNKKSKFEEAYTTKDDFIKWIKDLIKKGQVSRIKIKKDDKVIVDIPVNAGIIAGIASLYVWPVAVAGILTAVVTKVTIEITKKDGTVQVVNKLIKSTSQQVKEKVNEVKEDIKEKINKNDDYNNESNNVYQYTVNFEDTEEKKNEDKEEN